MKQQKTDLEWWWKERGYTRNPFLWSNAADVQVGNWLDLFEWWHIDPKMPAEKLGLGQSPILDGVKSLDSSRLVLIYVPAGGGKTFYRRWAADQIEKGEEGNLSLEIWNLLADLPDPKNITTRDLAFCFYDRLCDKFGISKSDSVRGEHPDRILKRCDEAIAGTLKKHVPPARVYVFVDDIEQFFDEHPSGAKQNAKTLESIVELCKAFARRNGGNSLVARMFIPAQLQKYVQTGLSPRWRRRILEHEIVWDANHCRAIVEKRLDSLWKSGRNTGIGHMGRLLTDDAYLRFAEWLERQKNVSPRCVIEVFDQLTDYACQMGVRPDEFIVARLWDNFVESPDLSLICGKDVEYPIERPSLRFSRWIFFALIGVLSLIAAFYFSPLSHRVLDASVSVYTWLEKVIEWLADTSGRLGAFLLLAVFAGSSMFVAWCLIHNFRSNQPRDLRRCLEQAWELIRR